MNAAKIIIVSILTLLVFLTVSPVLADTSAQKTLYQTNFATNPRWTTNNPSVDYWDSSKEMYHFSIAPGTGNYAYSPAIDYEKGSFTLDYDVTLESVDEGSTFRLGFSGTEMDVGKGPNVITAFSNAKYGQIMTLRLITPSAKLMETTSDTSSYGGPTVKYAVNTPYHVRVAYDDDAEILTMTVTNKLTGTQLWSYFLSTKEPLKNMNRIYIGSVGDYGDGSTNKFATGWIDNIQLATTTSASVTTTPVTSPPTTQPTFSLKPTTKPTTIIPLTSIPTPAKKSPGFGIAAIAGVGIIGALMVFRQEHKKQ
ncbi:hypothetical protein [Methanoregula sp. UBA64]|jgi:hypothetical protein|uniref:hypothetical protein n=1 Tax=Methanoregula sp. UBA64 TaxID=1915554 RepID=UPI0025CED17D|nr:hypothetical protein [Methanoregula sp. UBA64]